MQVDIRKLSLDDYDELVESMQEAYPDIEDNTWAKRNIQKLTSIFPEGQLCITVDGKLAAAALSIIVQYELFGDQHTYDEITGSGTFNTHTNNGSVLYGIEVFVHPEFRSLRLGRRLYDARKELCEIKNLKSIIIGGRIPNYHTYSNELTPRQYINKVRKKEIYDPVLSFQLSNNFSPIKILKGYLKGDTESEEYAVLLQWNNIYYTQKKNTMQDSVIRIGLVQWQMRQFRDIEAFYQQVEFFVDVISNYESDFCVFPELFNTPLLAAFNHLNERESMEELSKLTAEIVDKIAELAVSYNVNIISGSMPILENGNLYNASYLLHRDGKRDEYRKIHITPNERKYYGMLGGDEVKAFDTDCGKIGIMICYDVEFPELTRILADQGMKLLFVPYLTDTQNAYTRVRACAAARAIENECYVAIAGCVGNLPGVSNMDIQFGQAAVFTPSDFAFPSNAVKGEATPNTEMTLIVDVDLNLLKELHHNGAVQTLKDRRKDLYDVTIKEKGNL
ncbi:carbon-nitrogen hydrolase family protein [Elizabethkingia anophelis]|uniref:Carbon-nitrogen hydrolase n=1 Tax=Elizabethkingia anophelis NUHP1 TaxID=1338011 RepID=A0A077EFM3_9FLAO|nr:bifunctional GNAT family N-acetyltransferase/carbon-nitrogen hydrolase family protein [Elizabethkingia anophelis]AIL46232.1 Carbon-nitrogen hydrolase [Elizabethkingia anophelis NUHP1]AKH94760.1 carbon-nitrogen hydrolase [Elizabethkingia anophelis FMS-007]AQW91987.1 carbon-nitrogen hydrolase [Elizabethkingia anophelis]AQW95302.1 carbon-nitrogen hydrolase [Elizabethkingia anophelis]EJC8061172.1 GNAT family N-acetyltransferase [Elizabethkingia anophelis]